MLVTPAGGRLYRAIRRALIDESYDRIDLVISFVMRSGVDQVASRIDDALERGAQVRLLTTDYLHVTDVGALGFFLDRIGTQPSGGQLDARVFRDPTTSFHPKAYIFSSSADGGGIAFVGSSNLSYSGLREGVEWNLETRELGALHREFDDLWTDERSHRITASWLDSYRIEKELLADRRVEHEGVLVADEEPEPPIAPWTVQREALAALVATRAEGHRAGLVVMATGLGKTWLAAFDSTRPEFRRVLFVAHRREILTQARDVYRRIRPGGSFTLYVDGEHDRTGDVVFASVQSLGRHLSEFEDDAFDYVIIDEAHHLPAPTYRQIVDHFRPAFLLGLTATPDRADAADLLTLCGDNLVYDCGLVRGVQEELLSPFRYRAIRDRADYKQIPWVGGRFNIEELTQSLATQQRAEQVFDEWAGLDGPSRRALGFCCSIPHADFMAAFFADRGVRAVSVHSGQTSADRSESLAELDAGETAIVFAVDLFNEGVDLPMVDLVMMLRPTESPVVFFQQLGRGLRRADGKTHLDVLDLVGNHRGFLLKARLLATLAGQPGLTDSEAVEVLRQEASTLPEGCSVVVDLEVIDLLAKLLGAPRRQDLLAEIVRTWVDDHEGRRPTALEMSLITNRSHDMKKAGGWFGLLDSLRLLSPNEEQVLGLARDFLLDIEHGSYTKSYKLVTLQSMLHMATLRGASPLRELATAARWQVFGDPRLLGDLDGAGSSFADIANPTEQEWARYWRKNPINALVGGTSTTARHWFELTDDESMRLLLQVPDDLATVFDDMVGEIVEYRLHRYLVAGAARRPGEKRQPLGSDGNVLDATFSVDSLLGRPISVLFDSAGGAVGGKPKRNPDYVAGIDAVLARLKELNGTVLDAYVDSGRTKDLPIPDRRLDPGADRSFPLELDEIDDLTAVRRSLLKSMAAVGRDPKAKDTGGNSRKAMRLLLDGVAGMAPAQLADRLAGSVHPDPQGSVTSMADRHT